MTDAIRVRRPPPPLRRAAVVDTQRRPGRFQRVTMAGPALVGLDPATPAASIRLLVPADGNLVLPEWNGNEYLHADGSRPHLRTLTPLRIDTERGEVEVDILLHGDGPMAAWAAKAPIGDPVGISGTGRGYEIDTQAQHLLAGDASAVPAITTVLAALPPTSAVHVIAEIDMGAEAIELDGPAGLSVAWHEPAPGAPPGGALVAAVRDVPIADGTRVWVAGEAASMQQIRRHLFDTLGLARTTCTVRGYWKHGRAGDEAE